MSEGHELAVGSIHTGHDAVLVASIHQALNGFTLEVEVAMVVRTEVQHLADVVTQDGGFVLGVAGEVLDAAVAPIDGGQLEE